MRMFGFDLHQIPRLQVQLHTERTVLVTPIEFEPPLSGHGLCAHLSSTIHQSVVVLHKVFDREKIRYRTLLSQDREP